MYLLSVVWLFLPAGIANMVPPFAVLLLPKMDQPLDFNYKFRGHRIFGDHKTIRGIVAGVVAGGLTFFLQQYFYQHLAFISNLSLIDYSHFSPLFGFALGFGALAGDALKSFFKRQLDIKPGISWFPWDQIDWVIGSLLISGLFIGLNLTLIVSYLFVGLALHLIIKGIGYLIKLNQSYI